MNKKGFASSTIIFGLLSVFLIAVSILLITVTNTSKVKNELNNNVVENIEYGSSTLNELEQKISELETKISSLEKNSSLDKIYPIGSIYMSTSISTTEGVTTALGGTWEVYSVGRMLIGAGTDSDGNTYVAGATSGSTSVTLSTKNLPAHTHTVTATGTVTSTFEGGTAEEAGAHKHTLEGVLKWPETITASSDKYSYNGWSANHVVYSDKLTTTKSAGSHTHTVTGTVTSTFTGDNVKTSSVGSGTAFSVQNPYTVVYMYKRVG